jgi:hypothetical protein
MPEIDSPGLLERSSTVVGERRDAIAAGGAFAGEMKP